MHQQRVHYLSTSRFDYCHISNYSSVYQLRQYALDVFIVRDFMLFIGKSDDNSPSHFPNAQLH